MKNISPISSWFTAHLTHYNIIDFKSTFSNFKTTEKTAGIFDEKLENFSSVLTIRVLVRSHTKKNERSCVQLIYVLRSTVKNKFV